MFILTPKGPLMLYTSMFTTDSETLCDTSRKDANTLINLTEQLRVRKLHHQVLAVLKQH